jgi:2-oxoglutarate dehydrogenase E2 component (dihydrolipoamide succinyltransferase)
MEEIPSFACPQWESITEGTLTQLSKQPGNFIEQDEELATIEADKNDVSVNAPHSGIIQQLLVAAGDTVTVDQVIAELRPEEKSSGEGAKNDAQDSSKLPSEQFESQILEKSEAPVAPVATESPAVVTTKPNNKKGEANGKEISAKTNDSSLQ